MRNPVGLDGKSGIQEKTLNSVPVTSNVFILRQKISFTVAHPGAYSISIFSVNGKNVGSIMTTYSRSGLFSVPFYNGMPASAYIVRLSGNKFMAQKRVTLY